MDTLTHSLAGMVVGAGLARDKKSLAAGLITGFLAATLPDLDSLLWVINLASFYLYHRLFTHNLLVTPVIAALAALPARLYFHEPFRRYFLIGVIAFLIHLALDIFPRYPLPLLFPFSRRDFSIGVIDFTYPPLSVALTILAIGIIYFKIKRWERRADSKGPPNGAGF